MIGCNHPPSKGTGADDHASILDQNAQQGTGGVGLPFVAGKDGEQGQYSSPADVSINMDQDGVPELTVDPFPEERKPEGQLKSTDVGRNTPGTVKKSKGVPKGTSKKKDTQ